MRSLSGVEAKTKTGHRDEDDHSLLRYNARHILYSACRAPSKPARCIAFCHPPFHRCRLRAFGVVGGSIMAGRSSASAMLRSRNGMSSQSMHRARDVLRIVLATYGFRALM